MNKEKKTNALAKLLIAAIAIIVIYVLIKFIVMPVYNGIKDFISDKKMYQRVITEIEEGEYGSAELDIQCHFIIYGKSNSDLRALQEYCLIRIKAGKYPEASELISEVNPLIDKVRKKSIRRQMNEYISYLETDYQADRQKYFETQTEPALNKNENTTVENKNDTNSSVTTQHSTTDYKIDEDFDLYDDVDEYADDWEEYYDSYEDAFDAYEDYTD